ncbi:MAG: universal stress protein [Anaerolineae bacterium]|nr:universal stress protein [Anaerolineae bacterium]
MFTCILLAIDGSTHSEIATRYACDLANRYQARVYVLYAYAPIPEWVGYSESSALIARRTQAGEEILDKAIATLREAGVEAEPELMEGPAAEAILAVARTLECDLIVMASRGRGQMKELLLGSVSHKVVSHAPCPVLITR